MKNTIDFPLLAEFARGYLHQDMIPEYGDAKGAARAYMHDLSSTERKKLAAESRKMTSAARDWSNHEVNRRLRRMGAACSFASKDELLELLKMFGRDE